MERLLKRPYELSVWGDKLVTENDVSYYKEVMLAVIGADDMDSPNKAYDVRLKEKVNGEIELTFSLLYKYFEEGKRDLVINPFVNFLINERKIKLKTKDDNNWYDFIIKNIEEDSEENIFNYTAQSLFVNELSKEGYNVELSSELNNNQGTVFELGNKVVESTDWIIDEENSDIIRQYTKEPLYTGILKYDIPVVDVLSTDDIITLHEGAKIYFFYSSIVNEQKENVHILLEQDKEDGLWELDDNNVYKAPNYRIQINLEYNNKCPNIVDNIESIVAFQGYRLAYKQVSKYDDITERYVELYTATIGDKETEIYHYTDYDYTTSTIVTNYITNSNSFSHFQDGSIQGWSTTTDYTGETNNNSIDTVTYPAVDLKRLDNIDQINQLKTFLKVHFNDIISYNKNTIFNQGIQDNNSIIGAFSKGEKYGLRIKYGITDKDVSDAPAPDASHSLRAKVAGYTIEDGKYIIDESKVYFDFTYSPFKICNNMQKGGYLNQDHTSYIRNEPWGQDIVPPSSKYYYENNDSIIYKWDEKTKKYIEKTSSDLNYILYKTECLQSLSNIDLLEKDIGIFLFSTDNSIDNYYYWIEDIELFKYFEDSNQEPVLIGNIPTTTSIETHYYYIPDKNIKDKTRIETYSSLESIANALGISEDNIKKKYNDKCEKIGSIEISQSNYFNGIQEICEKFECWARFDVEHNEDGSLKLDENFNPIKKISFHNYVGKDNYTGFIYGINLKSVNRTIESDEIVSKLIVAQPSNEYVDGGVLTIRNAESNPTGESYIYNFDYYIDKGLIDREDFNKDLYEYYFNIKNYNNILNTKNSEYTLLSENLTKLKGINTTYTELIKAAEIGLSDSKKNIKKITGKDYDDFMASFNNLEIRIKPGAPPKVTMSKSDLINFVIVDADSSVQIYPSENNELTPTQFFNIKSVPNGYDYPIIRGNQQVLPTSRISLADFEFDAITDEYIINLPISNNGNESLVKYVGQVITDNNIISSYSGFVYQLNKEYEELFLKVNGAPSYTLTISNINNRAKITLSDFKEGLELILHNREDSYYYNTTSIDKTFEWNKIATSITINNVPTGYKILDSNDEVVEGTIELQDNSTKVFTLAPTTDYSSSYKGLKKEIEELIEEKDIIEKNFQKKYSGFIQEGTWTSDDYVDNELYYLDAVQVSNTSAKPKISYTFDVLEISQIRDFKNYKFSIGDKTYVEDTEFFGYTLVDGILTPVKEEVIVSEIEWNLDDPSDNKITIQNYKTQFEDLFQRISAAVQSVEYNTPTYARAASAIDNNGFINSNLLLSSLQQISGANYNISANGAVSIESDGLLVKDITNTANRIKITSAGIVLSTDGGVTWNSLIDAKGLDLKKIKSGIIDTSQISIMNGNQTSFRWNDSGISAFAFNNNDYDFSKFVRMDQFGLYGVKGIDGIDGFRPTSISQVKDNAYFGLTWDGFFIRNSYTDGYVSISSDNDFQVIQKINDTNVEKIKIGALEFNSEGAPTKYGINIRDNSGNTVFTTGDDGNLTITGTIYATAGELGDLDVVDTITVGASGAIQSSNFSSNDGWKIDNNGATFNNAYVRGTITADTGDFLGSVYVGDRTTDRHISINGGYNTATESFDALPTIKSGNYSEGASYGWMIDGNGDATFNNVTVRGAIKTAVFEYEEIQAVGGAFLFRPSSTIRTAKIEGNDLIVTVEKPLIFRQGNWCKVSNYNTNIADIDNLSSFGLTYIYKIKQIRTIITTSGDYQELVLENAALSGEILDVFDVDELPGGALIDFGNENPKLNLNYGIGINSSDNYVNLPRRAISLFETEIHPNDSVKVTYDLKGVLGTLPNLSSSKASTLYANNMAGTQGIYTDNAYIGNNDQYMAYYTDNDGDKHLRIKAESVVFEILDDQGQGTGEYKNIQDVKDGESAIQVVVDSSAGNMFRNRDIAATLTCTVYEGTKDITNQVTRFTWKKKDKDGNIDSSWSRLAAGRTITITADDVASKAIFICEVEF